MNAKRSPRPVTITQLLGVLAFALALFFMVSFATKSVDAYRLRNWRDQALAEQVVLEHQRQALVDELRYRQSGAWEDEALRNTGQVAPGMVRVVVATRIVTPVPTPTVLAPSAVPSEPPAKRIWFRNPNWEAWRSLILGFETRLQILLMRLGLR
jgi:hypothetical protein